jgi:proliferating cell nuclear antigen
MFEARLAQSGQLKKIIESVKDIVTDANLDCSSIGLSFQVSFKFNLNFLIITI